MADMMPKKNYSLTEITALLLEIRENCISKADRAYEDPKRFEKYNALNAAIDLINNLSIMRQWISVHDEHPPKGSRVLVRMDDHGKTSMMVANYGEGGFWLPVIVPGKLTHWMMMDEKEAT